MAQVEEPVHSVQIEKLGCFSDEPVCGFEIKDPIQWNYPVLKGGFNELEEVLSRFQAGSICGSESNHAVHSVDEKKHRRMFLNRESARRSRLGKKRHLEKLKTELNQLKVQNREFKNRFRSVAWLNQMVQCENDRLKDDSLVLWSKLGNLCQILLSMQLTLNQ